MNAGRAVYGILSTNAEVTAIVGTKIFPEVAEQETALPLIVYQLQSVAPEDTHDGPSKLDEVRFEFLCYADTYNGAADLGDKVRGALDRVSGTYNAVNVESVQFNDVDIDVIDAPRRYGQSLTFTFRIKRDDVEIAQGTPVTGAMLGDLYNVDVAGVTDNQILSYDAATGNWVPADDAGGLVDSVNGLTGTVILNFDDLNDVDTGTPSDGQLIAYQQGEWVTIDQDEIHIPINSVTGLQTELNTIPTDLSDLNDVSIVGTPAGNQALIYNSATNAFTSQDSYTNRFEDEVETGKVMPTIFAERAYSVKSEGDGVFIDPESDTPAAGKVIVRKIYHKAGFITDADVIGDYTLIHTFADDTAYADTVATFEGFRDGNTYGTPPFTLLQTWAEETAAPTFTGLLNESYGSGAAAAYGTRRLNGLYSGHCMTIRRASDGTTQAIGFVGEEIDESAITTFCTGTTCTVQTWHDQSQTGGTGSGNDAEQTTAANQPTIYTGGALVKEGGRLGLQFASDKLGEFSISLNQPFTSTSVFKLTGTPSFSPIFGSRDGTGVKGSFVARTTNWWMQSTTLADTGQAHDNNQHLFYSVWNGSNSKFGQDGSALTTLNAGTTDWTNLAINSRGTDSAASGQDGIWQELIIWGSDKSTDRTSIEGNISAYYQSAKLLDESFGSGAEAAYSTRQLRRDQTDCMVIRRASDSTTTTIGFDSNGNIDEAAINTFCSGTTCTVYQWLDQSGNGNTATASGTEPIIYTGGAIIKDEGKVAINFNAAYSALKYTGQDLNLSAVTALVVQRIDTTTSVGSYPIALQNTNNDGLRMFLRNYGLRNRTTGTNLDVSFPQELYFTRNLADIASSTSALKVTFNGAVTATGSGKTFSTNGLDLAVGGSSFDTVKHTGSMQEAILFGVDKYTSGDIASIRENIGDYFTQNTPLLDTYSGAAAAYSLRLLDSSYVGSAIRVRRSSDNTEQDIGFNVFGELDTVSLLDFAGTGDAFVKTWYDQASTNDATQTTTANQPKIVSSGAVITENGKPAVDFDGSNDELPLTTYPFTGTDIYIGTVARFTSSTTEGNAYAMANGTDSFPLGFNRAGGSRYASRTIISGVSYSAGDSYNQQQALFTHTFTGTTLGLYKDGTQATQTYISRDSVSSAIGSRGGSFFHIGTMQEMIIYDSDQSSNRSNIETNIATFYDITI